MKFLIAFLFAVPAFGTNNVVATYAEVISAVNPHQVAVADHCSNDYQDVVASCHAGKSDVRFVAVADQNHCSKNDLVRVVRNRNVKVVVGHNVVRSVGLNGYGQTVVVCNQVRRVNGRLVRRQIRRSRTLFGRLVGSNARFVRAETDFCR